ncbi:MAG: hypothetical protein Fur0039_16290 [Rhodocyclaceae bacterium]
MPSSDLASRLRLLSESSVQPLAALRGIGSGLPEFVPGERFVAHIEAALADGNFRALVANRSVTLSLPHAANPGDTLELVVVEARPQAIVARLADAQAAAAPEATLSRAARLIADLASAPQPRPALLAGGAPVLPAPPAAAAAAAPLLRRAIGESGLFYESHQAEWLAGRRMQESLLREPQGARSPLLAPETAAGGARIPEELAMLARSQLDALATQRLAWEGLLWPGQAARWEIEEETGEAAREAARDGAAAKRRWVTSLQLGLPRLGNIRARLALEGARVDLRIEADSPDSRDRLRAAQPALARGLADGGLSLAGATIAS